MSSPAATVAPTKERSPADVTMRRLLRVPEKRSAHPTDQDVHRLFSASILISALRCLLSYVVFPIAAPFIGAAGGVAPAVGIPIALVALYFDARGIRRFWLADHKYRWPITALYLSVMVLVAILLWENIAQLA
ncbi:MAG: hypothetical protein ACYDGN_08095 [Acidimicrobiales bacterium]